jgi:hypothetical protein
MTSTRTVFPKYTRVYVDGRDMSGYARNIGPLSCEFDEGIDDALNMDIKAVWPGNATVGVGTLNGIFDNTATVGIHPVLKDYSVMRTVLVAVGMGAAPAQGDPTFCGQFQQTSYVTGPDQNPVTATMNFAKSSGVAKNLRYAKPWGILLHPLVKVSAANTAIGIDQGGQTTKGGYMCYQITAAEGDGNMTAAIRVQDASANNDGAFGSGTLLTTGTINCAGGGVSGIVALANPATVKQYVRWQITLGTATSVTFALAWVRNNL